MKKFGGASSNYLVGIICHPPVGIGVTDLQKFGDTPAPPVRASLLSSLHRQKNVNSYLNTRNVFKVKQFSGLF